MDHSTFEKQRYKILKIGSCVTQAWHSYRCCFESYFAKKMTLNRRKRPNEDRENYVEHKKNNAKFHEEKLNTPDAINFHEVSPVHHGAQSNLLDLLKGLLLASQNDGTKKSTGSTPLMLAARHEHYEAVRILLDFNADVFVNDVERNQTILQILLSKVQNLPVKVVARLLAIVRRSDLDAAYKADIFVKANCKIKLVLFLKDAEITREFLTRRQSTNDDDELKNALDFAMTRRDLDNVRAILQTPDCTSIRHVFYEKVVRLLHARTDKSLQYAKMFVNRLVEWDIVVEDSLEYLNTLFSIGDRETIEILLQHKVDVYVKQQFGQDIIVQIFDNRKVNAIEILENRPFDVNGKVDGFSALHFAVRSKVESNVRFLLDSGADIEIKDKRGRTPLLQAAVSDRKLIVEILLRHGADIRAVVHDRPTIFDPFKENFFPVVQEYLLAQLALHEIREDGIVDQSIRDRINANEKCKKFFASCCMQLEEMKRVIVIGPFTLFTAVADNIADIPSFLREEKIVTSLKKYIRQRRMLPFYYTRLKYNLGSGERLSLVNCDISIVASQYTESHVDFDRFVVGKNDTHSTIRNL